MDKKIIYFVLLIIASIWALYYVPAIVTTLFFVTLLLFYYNSKEEAFWLAYFLAISDGFFGFFGNYEALLTAIPGLPGIEVGQFYILLTIIKTINTRFTYRPFYFSLLSAVGIYVGFLVVQGYVVGLSMDMNVQFRILKYLLPFALFYTIPKLFTSKEEYLRCFQYLFVVVFFALLAQVFTIYFKTSPLQYFGAKEEYRDKILINLEVSKERLYRGIYNEGILIIGLFGALYSLAIRTKFFRPVYLYAVIMAIFFSYFISATRGYMLGFFVIMILSMIFVFKVNVKSLLGGVVISILIVRILYSLPVVEMQLKHSLKRMETMEYLIKGDPTAGGTLIRLTQRGPRVMRVWKDSKLTGWGFSDMYLENHDMHVGNQSILLHSGIIGALLMGLFFIYFNGKLFFTGLALPRNDNKRYVALLFGVFFIGWFMIHSSTQFYFAYHVLPNIGMVQAIFFGLGGLALHDINKFSNSRSGKVMIAHGV